MHATQQSTHTHTHTVGSTLNLFPIPSSHDPQAHRTESRHASSECKTKRKSRKWIQPQNDLFSWTGQFLSVTNQMKRIRMLSIFVSIELTVVRGRHTRCSHNNIYFQVWNSLRMSYADMSGEQRTISHFNARHPPDYSKWTEDNEIKIADSPADGPRWPLLRRD